MEYPAGTTLTSLALQFAMNELSQGRQDSESVVIVITDGVPQNTELTSSMSMRLKERARLMWIPVTWHAPVEDMEKWASEPVATNVVVVEDFEQLAATDTVNTIVANMCPVVM